MRPYGDRAFVVSPPDPAGLAAAARRLPEVVDAVPGAHDVVVVCGRAEDVDRVAKTVEALAPQCLEAIGDVIEIPIRYDGPDLATVCELAGIGADDVIARHAAETYTAAFMGFAPGFAYLRGLDPVLASVPRRPDPRARVRAGAVALAGGWTGVYPGPSPGGWHLIGSADVTLWDLARTPPALLAPGARVRFVPR